MPNTSRWSQWSVATSLRHSSTASRSEQSDQSTLSSVQHAVGFRDGRLASTILNHTVFTSHWSFILHVWPNTLLLLLLLSAKQFFCYRQLSRLRKSATSAVFSDRSCTVSCIRWLQQLNRCSMECGATPDCTNIWYAAGDAGLVSVQEPTVTRAQLGKCSTDRPMQQTIKWWDIRWRSYKDCLVQNSTWLLPPTAVVSA